MSNIKGLYFKLNVDNPCDKEIYDFFIQESKKRSVSKIDILYSMVLAYIAVKEDKK